MQEAGVGGGGAVKGSEFNFTEFPGSAVRCVSLILEGSLLLLLQTFVLLSSHFFWYSSHGCVISL